MNFLALGGALGKKKNRKNEKVLNSYNVQIIWTLNLIFLDQISQIMYTSVYLIMHTRFLVRHAQ